MTKRESHPSDLPRLVVVDAGEVQQRAAMEFDIVINYIDLCVSKMIRIYNILHSSMMVD